MQCKVYLLDLNMIIVLNVSENLILILMDQGS